MLRGLRSSFLTRFSGISSSLYYDKSLHLAARQLSSLNQQLHSLASINDVEFSVYSQWGEDGIIDWLLSRLNVNPHFLEFGVEDYTESNTRYLLERHNWTGIILDSSSRNINRVSRSPLFWRHTLYAQCQFITASNINDTIRTLPGFQHIDLLSIDLDGNDYWVWQSIEAISPVIVIVEYNAVLGDLLEISVPYREDFVRSLANPSNLYFGASIRSLIRLGSDKGYTLVGTTQSGCNAIFIRNSHAHQVLDLIREVRLYPSKYRESRCSRNKHLTFLSEHERYNALLPMRFVAPSSQSAVSLPPYEHAYSQEWIRANYRIYRP